MIRPRGGPAEVGWATWSTTELHVFSEPSVRRRFLLRAYALSEEVEGGGRSRDLPRQEWHT